MRKPNRMDIKINKSNFYVIKFIELPFKRSLYNEYVCVPGSWILLPPMAKQRVVVAYPFYEDPSITRERVKNNEKPNKKWKFYVGELKNVFLTFSDGDFWIASRNNISLLNNDSIKEETQPLYSATKRPAPTVSELSHQKRTRQSIEPVPSTSNECHYSMSGCSTSERPRHNQMNCNQTRAAARSSHGGPIAPQRRDTSLQRHIPQQNQEPGATVIDRNENLNEIFQQTATPSLIASDNASIRTDDISTRSDRNIRKDAEHKLLNQLGTLLEQVGATLQHTCTMYNELRLSQARKPPPLKKHNNLWRFVLPPEYDRHNSRWTLKYQKIVPGLMELMPDSGIYVSSAKLQICTISSEDCKSLAQRLLIEVFSRTALSVCASMTEKAQPANRIGSSIRPGLDEYASTVLLNYVNDFGRQRSWDTDLEPILTALHNMMQIIRFKYGKMVKC